MGLREQSRGPGGIREKGGMSESKNSGDQEARKPGERAYGFSSRMGGLSPDPFDLTSRGKECR